MQKCLLFVLLFTLSLTVTAQTIVERHGQLTVSGNRIKDECGRVTQLKGMSYFWSQWDGKEYYNANAVKWLRDDWKVEVVRAALGISPGSPDYIANPTENYNRVTAVLDGAVQHGIYGIADFHAHEADKYLAQSKTFFRQISQRYGDKPNIIYEIWNEPIGSSDDNDAAGRATWTKIKTYAREIIAVIRANDPDGLIVVGTPFYSQRVDLATESPLTTDINGKPVGNVAYTIHAYVGAHGKALRDKGDLALSRGYALFMTECGRTRETADGPVYPAEWDTWEKWMDDRGISYAKWSMANKDETCSVLYPGAPAGGGWTTAQLRPEGQWTRNHLRAVNATQPSKCGTTTPPTTPNPTTNNTDIYTDNFNNGWANYSWGGVATVRDAGIKQSGSYSFKYDLNGGGAISFRHPSGVTSTNLVRLEFWARTYTGSATFQVSGSYSDNYAERGTRTNATITTTWKKYTFTKAQLGNYGWYRRFFLYNGSTNAAVFIDNVRLVYSTPGARAVQSSTDFANNDEFTVADMEVYPNPSGGRFTVDLLLPVATNSLQVELRDVTGRIVLRQQQSGTAGLNRFNLEARTPAGVHFLRIYDSAGTVDVTRRVSLE